MTEYWVSNKKYFCEYCKVYIQDNIPSRRHHESSRHHKGSVAAHLRNSYKKIDGIEREKIRTELILRKIDKAAQSQYSKDISSGIGLGSSQTTPGASTSWTFKPYWEYESQSSDGYQYPQPSPNTRTITCPKSSSGIIGKWTKVPQKKVDKPKDEEGEKQEYNEPVRKVVSKTDEDFTKENKSTFLYKDLEGCKLSDFLDKEISNSVTIGEAKEASAIPIFRKRKASSRNIQGGNPEKKSATEGLSGT